MLPWPRVRGRNWTFLQAHSGPHCRCAELRRRARGRAGQRERGCSGDRHLSQASESGRGWRRPSACNGPVQGTTVSRDCVGRTEPDGDAGEAGLGGGTGEKPVTGLKSKRKVQSLRISLSTVQRQTECKVHWKWRASPVVKWLRIHCQWDMGSAPGLKRFHMPRGN